jgi:hypothetical protein
LARVELISERNSFSVPESAAAARPTPADTDITSSNEIQRFFPSIDLVIDADAGSL